MKRNAAILFILLAFASRLNAQLRPSEKIDSVFASVKGLTATSVKIIDADNGAVIYARNPNKRVVPASTVKLFTTAAALDFLGKDFPLSVKILARSLPENGTIGGDLVIKGFSNPFFTSAGLDSFAAEIYASGVRKIAGDIIGDDSYLDNRYFHENWVRRERSEVSVPPVSALILDNNEITLKFIPVPDKKKKYEFRFEPPSEFYDVNFSARVTGKYAVPTIKIRTAPKKITVNISGKIKARKRAYSYKAHADNPPLFVANLLYERLKEKGVEINGEPKAGKSDEKTVTLCEIKTTLEKAIEKADKESDNFIAELLLKTLGAEYCACEGSAFYGIQAIYDFAERKNISMRNVEIVDGSGISRYNRLTAEAVAELLSAMYDDAENFNVFYSSLAAAGTDGTLEERLTGFGLKNNFHGKTGTLNGVSALSGYFTAQSGKNVIVSILMNFNRYGAEYWREIQDEIIVYVTTGY